MATCGICSETFEPPRGAAGAAAKMCPACDAMRRRMNPATAGAPAARPPAAAQGAGAQKPRAAAPVVRPQAQAAVQGGARVAPAAKRTVIDTEPPPAPRATRNAAPEGGLDRASKVGLVIAGVLGVVALITVVSVKSKLGKEAADIEAHKQKLDAFLAELAAINVTVDTEATRMLALIEEQKPLWEKTKYASDVMNFKGKAQIALDSAKDRREFVKRLEDAEKQITDPGQLTPTQVEEWRRKLDDLMGRGSAFGEEIGKRVQAARTKIDRVYITRLKDDAKASQGDAGANRLALQKYAKAEDECRKLLDAAFNAKDEETKTYFTDVYKGLILESDKLVTSVFTEEAIGQLGWKDVLAGEAGGQWNGSPIPGFSFKLESGALNVVGPDDQTKLGLVSIGDREQWRNFVAEIEFSLDAGTSFDMFFRLGKSPKPYSTAFSLMTTGATQNVRAGTPVRAKFSMVGSRFTWRFMSEDARDPFTKDLSWLVERHGAIGLLIPHGTKVRFTKFRVKELR